MIKRLDGMRRKRRRRKGERKEKKQRRKEGEEGRGLEERRRKGLPAGANAASTSLCAAISLLETMPSVNTVPNATGQINKER